MQNEKKLLRIGNFDLFLTPNVYTPAEDTFFLEDCIKIEILKTYNSISICYEVGCGSGYIALVLKSLLPESTLFASDISKQAVEITKYNLHLNNLKQKTYVFQSDLLIEFHNMRKKAEIDKIDLLIFNPPYIPGKILPISEPNLELALLGGESTGDSVILEFLTYLALERKKILSREGKILILISSWNRMAKKWIESEDFFKIVSVLKKDLPHESLQCFCLKSF